jgi:hypothetical protein
MKIQGRNEMIGMNKNPVSVSPLGGDRWTLLQQTERGIAMNGVYDSPADALAYAAEAGLEVVENVKEEKK